MGGVIRKCLETLTKSTRRHRLVRERGREGGRKVGGSEGGRKRGKETKDKVKRELREGKMIITYMYASNYL